MCSLPLGETSLVPSQATQEHLVHTLELLGGTLEHLVHSLAIPHLQLHIPELQECTLAHTLERHQHQTHFLVHLQALQECTLPLGSHKVVVDLSRLHPRVDLALDHLLHLEDPLLL